MTRAKHAINDEKHQRVRAVIAQVTGALRPAHCEGPVALTDAAASGWIAIYPELSGERPGMHGAATARAEAHTAGLALTYSLLDPRHQIDHQHLEAAVAGWTDAQATSAWIFGGSLGDPTADDI